MTVTIDYDKLNTKQKQTYDFLVKVAKQPIDEKLEAALGLVGKPKPRVRKEAHEDKEAVAREAEGVLLHLRRVDTLMQKECLECHRAFATNYAYAGRCSDDCIKASLHRAGIEWNPEKTPQERWNGPDVNGEIPTIISPETLQFLKSWAVAILSWDDPKPELRISIADFMEEVQREEEALRNESAMSGDVYGGTDTTEIDWDSL
jgi:hypothetical protein